MGIADEADRTLFVGNLDQKVTEELLFELFLQAGPLTKVKIPRDPEGKQKSFGFAVFKHEESAPYGMSLLNGTSLFGRTLKVQFRAGSTHLSNPGQQDFNPTHTASPHGARTPDQKGSPSYSTPQHNLHRSFTSPDSLQRQVVMNNMWQIQMQQLQLQHLQQMGGGGGGGGGGAGLLGMPPLPLTPQQSPLQQGSRCGNGGGGGGSPWQQDSPSHSPRGQRQAYQPDIGGGVDGSYHQGGRDQRYPGSEGSGGGGGPARHHRGQRNDHYQQHDDRGSRTRTQQERWKDSPRDSRSWRRY